MIEQRCWICGSKKNLTGEHQLKKSILKNELRNGPVYLSTDKQRNRKIQGFNSDKLKSDAKLCAYCNNQRTQPHDLAYDRLCSFLKLKQIQTNERIDLKEIFPDTIHASMLNVHLYFIKKFGCEIIANNIPIDIKPFSEAILQNKPHDKVYIAICPGFPMYPGPGNTNLEMDLDPYTGKVVFAVWYNVPSEPFSIRIVFSEPNQHRNGLHNVWHPSKVSRYIKVSRVK